MPLYSRCEGSGEVGAPAPRRVFFTIRASKNYRPIRRRKLPNTSARAKQHSISLTRVARGSPVGCSTYGTEDQPTGSHRVRQRHIDACKTRNDRAVLSKGGLIWPRAEEGTTGAGRASSALASDDGSRLESKGREAISAAGPSVRSLTAEYRNSTFPSYRDRAP
jgi:hypothetical protein